MIKSNSVLTPSQAAEIRQRYMNSNYGEYPILDPTKRVKTRKGQIDRGYQLRPSIVLQHNLANEYGVAVITISKVLTNRIWPAEYCRPEESVNILIKKVA